MHRAEAIEQYNKALKLGQKEYKTNVVKGGYPYLQVLDEILDDSMTAGRVEVGLVDIPTNQIVGTKTGSRRTAFASNFMPLLPVDTEFGAKWIMLCMAHLSDEGIRDPIKCYEYLGRFYVQEGNKRVSVLKSYGAATIPGYVVRILPRDTEDERVQVYYEFLDFYRLSGIYQIQLPRLGEYAKLQAQLGYEPDQVWTEEERRVFLSRYSRFCQMYDKLDHEGTVTSSEAFLVWLRVYDLQDLMDMPEAELSQSILAVLPDVHLLTEAEPIAVSTEPQTEEKHLLSRFFDISKPNHLTIAFIYSASLEKSAWSRGHEMGREYLQNKLGDRITTRVYEILPDGPEADEVMEQAVEDGAQVLVATTPPLIGACRKVAARHPELRVLNCSLSMPYAGVRTYYSRIYEGKFITGAIAGAMAREDTVGYVANYPIFGVPAGINAYALGVKMTNPRAKVCLQWSCLPGRPADEFRRRGVSVISNREVSVGEEHSAWEWGTYQHLPDGRILPLASPCWAWGKFYEKVILSIFSGGWDNLRSREGDRAVNYWWGMDSGVIDVQLSEELPAGVRHLAQILKKGLSDGSLDPFQQVIYDQNGQLRNDGKQGLSPEELMYMDWLCDNVDGRIPAFEELLPMSQNMVRLLGLYRDELPPEKEGVIL